MKISEFQTVYFTSGSTPSRNTVLKWLREGTINGKKIGDLHYVVIDEKIDSSFGQVEAMDARRREYILSQPYGPRFFAEVEEYRSKHSLS
jgi:hypothetical protein|tara:strand:+ start:7585 stop:7854 length:270 start_codon:yes stop_codon:yes gene_type:complete